MGMALCFDNLFFLSFGLFTVRLSQLSNFPLYLCLFFASCITNGQLASFLLPSRPTQGSFVTTASNPLCLGSRHLVSMQHRPRFRPSRPHALKSLHHHQILLPRTNPGRPSNHLRLLELGSLLPRFSRMTAEYRIQPGSVASTDFTEMSFPSLVSTQSCVQTRFIAVFEAGFGICKVWFTSCLEGCCGCGLDQDGCTCAREVG
jgi:hypothetical protein